MKTVVNKSVNIQLASSILSLGRVHASVLFSLLSDLGFHCKVSHGTPTKKELASENTNYNVFDTFMPLTFCNLYHQFRS